MRAAPEAAEPVTMRRRVTQSRPVAPGRSGQAARRSYRSAKVVDGSGANAMWVLQALHTSSSSASSTEKTTSSPHDAQSRRMFMRR